MKVRDGFYMKHYGVADGVRYRAEASRAAGSWTGEVYREPRSSVGSGGRLQTRHTIEDVELADATDGDEVCDLAWKRLGLEG